MAAGQARSNVQLTHDVDSILRMCELNASAAQANASAAHDALCLAQEAKATADEAKATAERAEDNSRKAVAVAMFGPLGFFVA